MSTVTHVRPTEDVLGTTHLGGYSWNDNTTHARLFALLHSLSVESGRLQAYYSDLYHDAMLVSELTGNETVWFIVRSNGTHLTMNESWRDAVLDAYEWDTHLMVWRIELASSEDSETDYNQALVTLTEGI